MTTTTKRPAWTLQIVTDEQQHSMASGNGHHSLIIITYRCLRISLSNTHRICKYKSIHIEDVYKCIRKEILIIWINSRTISAKLNDYCYYWASESNEFYIKRINTIHFNRDILCCLVRCCEENDLICSKSSVRRTVNKGQIVCECSQQWIRSKILLGVRTCVRNEKDL